MNEDKLKISELQKEVQELKEENKNLEWMLKKQFESSLIRIKEEQKTKNKMKTKELKRQEELIRKIFSITPKKDLKIFLLTFKTKQ